MVGAVPASVKSRRNGSKRVLPGSSLGEYGDASRKRPARVPFAASRTAGSSTRRNGFVARLFGGRRWHRRFAAIARCLGANPAFPERSVVRFDREREAQIGKRIFVAAKTRVSAGSAASFDSDSTS
jgi:hypothetical protein